MSLKIPCYLLIALIKIIIVIHFSVLIKWISLYFSYLHFTFKICSWTSVFINKHHCHCASLLFFCFSSENLNILLDTLEAYYIISIFFGGSWYSVLYQTIYFFRYNSIYTYLTEPSPDPYAYLLIQTCNWEKDGTMAHQK